MHPAAEIRNAGNSRHYACFLRKHTKQFLRTAVKSGIPGEQDSDLFRLGMIPDHAEHIIRQIRLYTSRIFFRRSGSLTVQHALRPDQQIRLLNKILCLYCQASGITHADANQCDLTHMRPP